MQANSNQVECPQRDAGAVANGIQTAKSLIGRAIGGGGIGFAAVGALFAISGALPAMLPIASVLQAERMMVMATSLGAAVSLGARFLIKH